MISIKQINRGQVVHAHSEFTGQEWLIKIMQALGYENIKSPGRCFGIAAMAMQAFLAGEENVFNERIHYLYQLSQLPEEQIKLLQTEPMEDTIVDVRAFLDGIALYQDPASYREIFSTERLPTQHSMFALPIILPKKLDHRPPKCYQTCCGVYDRQQLIDYIRLLQDILMVRTSLMLHSINHSINLSFDPQKQQWILFDANHLPAQYITDVSKLAKMIIGDFDAGHQSTDYAIFQTSFFVCEDNKKIFNQNYCILQSHEKWRSIHQITSETVTKRDAFHNNLLFVATKYKDYATIEALLKAGANPEQHNIDNYTALQIAIEFKDLVSIKMFLNAGANPNHTNPLGVTFLYFSAQNGEIGIVKALLEAKANPEGYENADAWVALHCAANNGYVDIVQVLLEAGANPSFANAHHDTPLHFAAQHGYIEIVKLLLENKVNQAQPNYANLNGDTPLHFATAYKHTEVIKMLLKHGADPNSINKKRKTPLHFAIQLGSIEDIERLLENHANPNYADLEENTSLHLAVQYSSDAVVNMLLEAHAYPNYMNHKGQTPLHLAAQFGRMKVVQSLLEAGANPNCKDENDKTMTHFLLKNNNSLDAIIAISKINVTIEYNIGFFGTLKKFSTFFEILKALCTQLQWLNEPSQKMATILCEKLYQLGKIWIEKEVKDDLFVQTYLKQVLTIKNNLQQYCLNLSKEKIDLKPYQHFVYLFDQASRFLEREIINSDFFNDLLSSKKIKISK